MPCNHDVSHRTLSASAHAPLPSARYEKDHWDAAIVNYREFEYPAWSAATAPILEHVRDAIRSEVGAVQVLR